MNSVGTQKITVKYNGKTATFNVTVVKKSTQAVSLSSISIKSAPKKTSYYVGETLDTTGLELTAHYSDGSTKTITSGFACSPTYFSSEGTKTITVTYDGKTATFEVTVKKESAKVLSYISIKSEPTKTSYYVEDSLDTSGLELTAHYTDGSTKTITSGFSCSPTYFSSEGTKQITVTYEGKKAYFNVSVFGVTSISINSYPTQTAYLWFINGDGDGSVHSDFNIDLTGLSLIVNYSDGSYKAVSTGFTCIPTELPIKSGTYTITVSYGGKTTSFEITVRVSYYYYDIG